MTLTTSSKPPAPVMSRAAVEIMTSRRSFRMATASASGSVTGSRTAFIFSRVNGSAASPVNRVSRAASSAE